MKIYSEAVLNLSCDGTGAKKTKKSPKAHTKTDTSRQEKLFGEIQNSFSTLPFQLSSRTVAVDWNGL